MIIFNLVGVGMLALCFGVAYGAGLLIGTTAENPLMVIAGPLLFVCDVLYRRKHTARHISQWWYHPRLGGQLFFAPVWAFGLFWMLLGTYRLLAGGV